MSDLLTYCGVRALLLGLCIGVIGCTSSQPPSTGPAAPAVTVSYPLEREMADYAEYPGRTASVESLEVRARVGGYLQQIFYAEDLETLQQSLARRDATRVRS